MKKVYKLSAGLLITLSILSGSTAANAQGFKPGAGFKQLNFGFEFDNFGLPVYVGMDFGVSEMVTIGPRVMFASETEKNSVSRFKSSIILPSIRGDYHFSGHIDELPSGLDIYAGASIGIAIASYYHDYEDGYGYDMDGSASEAKLWVQLGSRYYFAPKWAVQLEFVSYGSSGSLGVSYKF